MQAFRWKKKEVKPKEENYNHKMKFPFSSKKEFRNIFAKNLHFRGRIEENFTVKFISYKISFNKKSLKSFIKLL